MCSLTQIFWNPFLFNHKVRVHSYIWWNVRGKHLERATITFIRNYVRVVKAVKSLLSHLSFFPPPRFEITQLPSICLTTLDIKLVSEPEGVPEKGARTSPMGEPWHHDRLRSSGRIKQNFRGHTRPRWFAPCARSFLSRRAGCGQ